MSREAPELGKELDQSPRPIQHGVFERQQGSTTGHAGKPDERPANQYLAVSDQPLSIEKHDPILAQVMARGRGQRQQDLYSHSDFAYLEADQRPVTARESAQAQETYHQPPMPNPPHHQRLVALSLPQPHLLPQRPEQPLNEPSMFSPPTPRSCGSARSLLGHGIHAQSPMTAYGARTSINEGSAPLPPSGMTPSRFPPPPMVQPRIATLHQSEPGWESMWEGLWKERGGNRPLEGAAAADRERQPASFRAGAWGAKPQQYVNRGASVPVLLEKGGTVGIALTQRRRGEAIVVVAVENGLPAAVDGRIQVGDSLIAVDGIPVPALLQDVLLLMQGDAGSVVRLSLERGLDHMDVTLTRASVVQYRGLPPALQDRRFVREGIMQQTRRREKDDLCRVCTFLS